MRPVIIEGFTHALGAPQQWDQEANGRCSVLHIRAEVIQGVGFLRSAWEVEGREAGALLAGARLVMGIAGMPTSDNQIAHPAVHLDMTEVPEDSPPSLTARQFAQADGTPAVHVEMIFGPGQCGVCTVGLNQDTLPQAIALATENIMAMARVREWIA